MQKTMPSTFAADPGRVRELATAIAKKKLLPVALVQRYSTVLPTPTPTSSAGAIQQRGGGGGAQGAGRGGAWARKRARAVG